ncbi:MAG: hemerythrin domain-containing protein [Methanomassiliicoccaceae archaeon]|jgi:hypothetical protein|nr:hypothetical protein [Euryarchaeota archaeon]HOB38067.1 hypothetical protein [Methanomassiliicoccaceae archaeon]HOQ25959.1 hypothetical protein [Methanomassiliicoccaceae archaeon]HPP44711.1 hypothetical protein [Methanomassiliicoccaceae archaeon]HQA22037.1 hypothetical protein [Methanomassiliicoccaceae archaeon]
MEVPSSLRKEHEELLSMLERAMAEPGEVGEAAKAVSEKLMPHFHKEEELALPQLGCLTLSGEGRVENPERVVELSERLKEELPIMLEEHVQIAIALESLRAAAESAGKGDHVRFADMLLLHAQMEEEVLYPASLLIGAYIRQRLTTRG